MKILLIIILLFGLYIRLYHLDAPLADWHSWRQADTAAVTRNFIKMGFNPLLPRYDDMSEVSGLGLPNPNRFRFVEFPLYNIVVYPFYKLFGINIVYDRLVSTLFSLGSTILIYFIGKRYLGAKTGLLAAAFFALLPFNVYFSRTTLPEPTFVFFSLGMVYFTDLWIFKRHPRLFVLSFLFTMIAFLLKPWAIFFFLPLVYLVLKKDGLSKLGKYTIIFLVALLPFVLWRLWILQHPEGIAASGWLFNGDGIRFHPAFFWWLIGERMGQEIMGAAGLVLFTIGLIFAPVSKTDQSLKYPYFLHFWLLSSLLFMVVVATGNVRHNYYQISFVPIVCLFLASGFWLLMEGGRGLIPRIWTIALALLLLPSTFYFTYTKDIGFYQINNPSIVKAGREADKILPKDARVLAPYNGDTAFLYQVNRPGWAFVPSSIEDLVNTYGISAYVSTNYDDKTNWVIRHFKVLEKNPEFVIADLTKITEPLDSKDPEP